MPTYLTGIFKNRYGGVPLNKVQGEGGESEKFREINKLARLSATQEYSG